MAAEYAVAESIIPPLRPLGRSKIMAREVALIGGGVIRLNYFYTIRKIE
jgi:hypothetical protein